MDDVPGKEAIGDEWKAYYYHYMMYGAKEIATGQRANFMK